MEKYNKYKDSGVEWLGVVPEHWELKRAKDISTITRGAILRPVDEPLYYDKNGEWFYLNISDIKNCGMYLDKAKLRLSKLGSRKSARVKANSLILTASATIGKPFINKVKVCIHDGFIPFMDNKINNRFLFYYLLNTNIYSSMGKSNTQKNIYLDEVKNISISFPSNKNQTQIANYLDAKTTAIDKKIKLLQQKIKHYKAYRKTFINETVTKGLNKSVKLKDSGIDWIGEIPEHWELKKGKDCLKIKYGVPLDSRLFTNDPEKGFPMIRIRDLVKNRIQNSYEGDVLNIGLVNDGDILTGMDGEFNTVKWSSGKALLNQRICSIDPKGKGSKDFLFYYLPIVFKYINDIKHFTTVKHLSANDLNNMVVIYPSINEQQQIVNYLDDKTTSLNKIIKNIETQVTTIKELRKTLINEVVTGKVRITA